MWCAFGGRGARKQSVLTKKPLSQVAIGIPDLPGIAVAYFEVRVLGSPAAQLGDILSSHLNFFFFVALFPLNFSPSCSCLLFRCFDSP
jgi:hypothetical protein